MKTLFKYIAIANLLLVANLAQAGLVDSVADLAGATKLMGAQRAKDVCSCFFIAKQTQDYCIKFAKHGLPIYKKGPPPFYVKIYEKEKQVMANGQRAFYTGERNGCISE